jgi:hypothetical protein
MEWTVRYRHPLDSGPKRSWSGGPFDFSSSRVLDARPVRRTRILDHLAGLSAMPRASAAAMRLESRT